jgi:multidrug resistance efflux pump
VVIAPLAVAAYAIWDRVARYEAYGTIGGCVIPITAPCDGVAKAIHVRKGDSVRQGQLLVTMEDPQLDRELERLRDELRIARATLDAELAKLRWNLQIAGVRGGQGTDELLDLWNVLAQENAAVADVEMQREHSQSLHHGEGARGGNDNAAGGEGLGQRTQTVESNPLRAEPAHRAPTPFRAVEGDLGQLAPALERIQSLRQQIIRKRQELKRCEVRSPTRGTVVGNQRFAGEHVGEADAMLGILQEDSLEAVVYFPQRRADSVRVGERIRLAVGRRDAEVMGIVHRIADRLGPPPPTLCHFYGEDAPLRAVYLRPEIPSGVELGVRLGSLVKVPYRRRSSRTSGADGPP